MAMETMTDFQYVIVICCVAIAIYLYTR